MLNVVRLRPPGGIIARHVFNDASPILNGVNSADVLLECPCVVAVDVSEPDVEGRLLLLLLLSSIYPSVSVLVQIHVEAYMFTLSRVSRYPYPSPYPCSMEW